MRHRRKTRRRRGRGGRGEKREGRGIKGRRVDEFGSMPGGLEENKEGAGATWGDENNVFSRQTATKD